MITVIDGWVLFMKGLKESRLGSVEIAAEWVYRLNVFARTLGRHLIVDQICSLKNEMIKYLYQHGYSIEVTLQTQDFECWGVPGWGCDDDCPRCGGTGIYRTEKLYAFR